MIPVSQPDQRCSAVSTETSCFWVLHGRLWSLREIHVRGVCSRSFAFPPLMFLFFYSVFRYAANCDDQRLTGWLSVRYYIHTRALTPLLCDSLPFWSFMQLQGRRLNWIWIFQISRWAETISSCLVHACVSPQASTHFDLRSVKCLHSVWMGGPDGICF